MIVKTAGKTKIKLLYTNINETDEGRCLLVDTYFSQ